MKNLLTLITIMFVGGCGKDKEAKTKTKVTEDNNATKPVKELTAEQKQPKTLRDSVVGEYKHKFDTVNVKYVFLENGTVEDYMDGKKAEAKWSIVDEEIQVKLQGIWLVYRINEDKSITLIASIRNGRRYSQPKELQTTLKKTK